MRLFFAVNLADEVRSAINASLAEFAALDPPWRWVKSENLHITLKFLGEMEESSVEDLVRYASEACAAQRSFQVDLDRFGAFPNFARPRVLFFAASAGAAELRSLSSGVEMALAKGMRIPREKKPFRAHVTVARVKRAVPQHIRLQLEAVPPLDNITQVVNSISLMRSELGRAGAKYHRLKEIALR